MTSSLPPSMDIRALLRRFTASVERSSYKDLILHIAIAAGSVFVLAKLLRALAHYAFPRYHRSNSSQYLGRHLLTDGAFEN